MTCVLGVDGGNTKTIALVARDGQIVGTGRGGCGDIYGVRGADGALDNIQAACESALSDAGIAGGELAVAVFSLAGADWPEDFTFLRDGLAQRGFTCPIEVVNDAIGALRAGSADGTGVSVVCGTGTAVGARGSDGRIWHVSFWLSEAHGSSDLGRRAFQALLRAELGIDPPTTLGARVCARFGAPDVSAWLHRIYRRGGEGFDMRQLAPILLDECQRGDETSIRLVTSFGRTLGDYALVAARRVGLEQSPFDLVLSGGVLRSKPACLVDAIVASVRAAAPLARPVLNAHEPAVGALLMAFELAGARVDDALWTVLAPTLPSAPLYAT